MKNKRTNVLKWCGLLTIITLIAIIGFSMVSCGDITADDGNGNGDNSDLSGTITISPTTATVGATLTAVYSGTETVSYQWNKDGSAITGKTATTLTADTAGSYTVTVRASGYNSKTSEAVDVNDPSLSILSGTITINPNSGVAVNTELTATYSGSETVNYQWKKDGSNVGTNSNKFTPTTAGSYTVIVSASGYNSKTSNSVTVTSDDGTNTNPKSIKITGIISPANTKGNVEVSIFSGNDDLPGQGIVAIGTSDIVNQTVSVDLYNWTSDGGTSANRWTGNGEWCIRLRFFNSIDNHKYEYTWKNWQKCNIRDAVTELNFADFVFDWEGNNGYGWDVWRDNNSTATLNCSIANDGVCTVTIGGIPEKHGVDGMWNAWKISANYAYTGNAGKRYEYTFEAWTESGARNLHIEYYCDNDDSVYLNDSITITTTRNTYIIRGQALPKSGGHDVQFQLADQPGTVNIKMLKIGEYNDSGTDTDLNNWSKWETPGTTATLDYSVAADGVCTITVGGTPEPGDTWWKVNAQLQYAAKANTRYAYTFEAWTQSGDRSFRFQYYNDDDNDENVSLNTKFNITGTRKTYTIYGEEIPKDGIREVEFQCANQTGTFYVKMLEIKEFKSGWYVWRDDSSTATLDCSIDDDDICTVTVGGTPEKHGVDGVWNEYKIRAEYAYTGNAGKCYDYTFEAWTESGTRNLHVQYYHDNDDSVYLGYSITITTTRKSYTVYGEALPKSGKDNVGFQLADQLGTVNIKMLEIKEDKSGDNGGGGTNTDPKSIKITGIVGPANTKKNVRVDVNAGDQSPGQGVVAKGSPEIVEIVNQTVLVELYNATYNSTGSDRWTGNGEWCIRIQFFNNDDNHQYDYIWKHGRKYNIRDAVTELDFADFVLVWEEGVE